MPARLAALLDTARHELFVGRHTERALFAEALAAAAWPFHVCYVHGPGGIGKTAFLRELAYSCAEAGVACHYLDARDFEPSVEALVEALRRARGLAAGADLLASLDEAGGRVVVLVDTYELLASLDRWMRGSFVPMLPQNVLLVLAGRMPPALEWSAEPGLRSLVRVVPLVDLSEAESRRYLHERGVPAAQHDAVVGFAHGHPLALSLVADAFALRPDLDFEVTEVPDVVGALLKRFLAEVPGADRQAAIEASALVRSTDEAVLAAMLEREDVHALFEWLRGLSFMQAGSGGLFPHDLAREVLAADLQWRNRERYQTLHRRARRFYTRRLRQHPAGSERVLSDYFFLYRDHALVRPFFRQLRAQWTRRHDWRREAADVVDREAVVAMVEHHEGAVSAGLAAYWLERRPEGLRVFRDRDGTLEGFVYAVPLHETTREDCERDPAVAAARAYLDAHAPLRGKEAATLFRFWMDRNAYQGVSPVQSLFFVYTIDHYLTTPRLAYTFLPCARPAFWKDVFTFVGLHRLPAADFETDGQAFGAFGHDWRVVDPAAWLEHLAEKGSASFGGDGGDARPSVLVLDREAFDEAVQDALRSFTVPDALRDNPLLRSRLVLDRSDGEADAGARVHVLRGLICDIAQRFDASPREAKFFRAVYHTYLDPMPTQERAAERLELPFSTYRRYLRNGIACLADALWTREVGA